MYLSFYFVIDKTFLLEENYQNKTVQIQSTYSSMNLFPSSLFPRFLQKKHLLTTTHFLRYTFCKILSHTVDITLYWGLPKVLIFYLKYKKHSHWLMRGAERVNRKWRLTIGWFVRRARAEGHPLPPRAPRTRQKVKHLLLGSREVVLVGVVVFTVYPATMIGQ